ncbi:hypothetical protein LTR56_012480 [Elasticomyces elasticus]|nr:hypothetical protein LTR56_012480 [Elasticomyces elasticus]KAK3647630.1 hypothetical protein LTR22_013685 [Elasticomyces elasticus]KAK4906694.1 hypothetical protein LTR49_024208 [Elasticomyces elasticus]KAK5763727.1 hypothetical protein LTS12_006060 [Elasticomyces elasticus]
MEHSSHTTPTAPARAQQCGLGMPPPLGPRALEDMRRSAARSTVSTHPAQSSNPFAKANASGGNVGMLSSGPNPTAEGESNLDAVATTHPPSAQLIGSSTTADTAVTDAMQTAQTTVSTSQYVTMLAQVMVDRAGNGEGAVCLINEIVRLSVMQYGRSVLQNKHISGMLVEGELSWIIASLNPDLAQALSAATSYHGPTAAASTNERTAGDVGNTWHHPAADARVMSPLIPDGDSGDSVQQPEGHKSTQRMAAQGLAANGAVIPPSPQLVQGNAPLWLVRSAADAPGENRALPSGQMAKRKAGKFDDHESDVSHSETDWPTSVPSPRGENLQILTLLANYPVASIGPHADHFVEMIYDRLVGRCALYETNRKYATSDSRLPPLVHQGRDRHDKRLNWSCGDGEGMRATLENAAAKHTPDTMTRLESALAIFVRWNRALFPELPSEMYRQMDMIDIGSHRSSLDVLRAPGNNLTIPRKAEVSLWAPFCSTIFDLVRSRVASMRPASALLKPLGNSNTRSRRKRVMVNQAGQSASQHQKMKTSLLTGVQYNFWNTLIDCIAESYELGMCVETALEVEIYRLAKQEPSAFAELFCNVLGPVRTPSVSIPKSEMTSAVHEATLVSRSAPSTMSHAAVASSSPSNGAMLDNRSYVHPVSSAGLHQHTIIKLLWGHLMLCNKHDAGRQQILAPFSRRMDQYKNGNASLPALVLRGRTTAYYRIDFASGGRSASNLESRLRRQFGAYQRCASLDETELMLRHVAAWNPSLFPELHIGRAMPEPVSPGPFRSALSIALGTSDETLHRPLRPTNGLANSLKIFNAIRSRVCDKIPNSPLLCLPDATFVSDENNLNEARRSLTAKTTAHPINFQETLRACFSNHDNEPGTIEEALEATVFEFATHVPKAFPEYFG